MGLYGMGLYGFGPFWYGPFWFLGLSDPDSFSEREITDARSLRVRQRLVTISSLTE